MLPAPHPFAPFVRLLGRGKTLTRSLTAEEAEQAMAMILAGEALPEQLGAFLMLMRVKEETGEEIAGFIRAARAAIAGAGGAGSTSTGPPTPARSGNRRGSCSRRCCSRGAGWRVACTGSTATPKGAPTPARRWRALGVPLAADFAEARAQSGARSFAYLSLERDEPGARADDGAEARPRPALARQHAGARPQPVRRDGLDAGGVSSRLCRDPPRRRAALGEGRTLIFRGDGGENERRPNKTCETTLVAGGAVEELRWPPMVDPRQAPEESLEVERLAEVWRGGADEYGEAAVVGTIAIALYAMGVESDPAKAEARAGGLWGERDRARLPAPTRRPVGKHE